jgi:hypothetical protein
MMMVMMVRMNDHGGDDDDYRADHNTPPIIHINAVQVCGWVGVCALVLQLNDHSSCSSVWVGWCVWERMRFSRSKKNSFHFAQKSPLLYF